MATYQEQLAKLGQSKAEKERAEKTLDIISDALATALSPHIAAGRISMEDAGTIMVTFVDRVVERKRGEW